MPSKPYVFGPGVYDPMGAELVMYHGFDAVYFSGYSFAMGHLGTTDMDLYSSVEIADGARRTVSALRKFQLTMAMGDPEKGGAPVHLDIPPVVVDMDAGYGNLFNVQRTVDLYVRAGVAAAHLEDQVMPKRCGHIAGKALISADEFVGKLKMMRNAADDLGHKDFVIIARTDGVSATEAPESQRGMALAVERGLRYLDSGVPDLLWCEFPTAERGQVEIFCTEIRKRFPKARFAFNYSSSFKWINEKDPITWDELGDLGRRVHLHHPCAAARGGTRNVGPARRFEAGQGGRLHGPAAQGMGAGRRHPDSIPPPVHRSPLPPARGPGLRGDQAERRPRRGRGGIESSLINIGLLPRGHAALRAEVAKRARFRPAVHRG